MRYMEDAENYRITYLFYRSFAIFATIMLYILYREKSNFIQNLKRSIRSSVILKVILFHENSKINYVKKDFKFDNLKQVSLKYGQESMVAY